MPIRQTKRQFRFLLSKGSPLTKKQKERLRSERRQGTITFKKSKSNTRRRRK